MKITFSIGLLLITLNMSIANAVDNCSALFDSHLQSFINHYRQSHLLPIQADMPILEPGYSLIGFLGESTAKAYLGMDTKTKALVVVKRGRIIEMLWRELAITDYLLEIGERVPKILKASIKADGTTIIVREYFMGLTGVELESELYRSELYRYNLPAELSENTLGQLDLEILRLKTLYLGEDKIHLSFEDWYALNAHRLTKKYPEIWEVIQGDSDILSSVKDYLFLKDFSENNFLFDPQRNKWLLFDP